MESEPRYDATNGERSLGELFRQLSRDLGTLLRQESELARVEIRNKAAKLGASAAELGAGGLIAFAGLQFLLLAAVFALADALDSPPLGALIVGVATLLVGALLLARGRSHMKAEELAPTRTIDSLRKDAELARNAGQDLGAHRGPMQRST
jgi:hypothetical protein